ncbi:MAG: HYR domain-containing protein [Lewinellaceae bacterium]|nr:HYR domain-containing protein [Lewinellaceae bacterium]
MIKKFTQGFPFGASLSVNRWFLVLALPIMLAQTVQAQLNYVPVACADPYVQVFGQPGAVDLGVGDDVIFTNIALPFPFLFYTTSYTTVNIGTNGFIVFLPGTNRGLGNTTLPTATAGAAMYPFWDDLDINTTTSPNGGVYTLAEGTAPNRIFTIEWFEVGHFPDAANQIITFQVKLFENGNRIQFKYFDTVFGGGQAALDDAANATVGLEDVTGATPRPSTLVGFNTAGAVTSGQCIEFILPGACDPIPGPALSVNVTPGTCEGAATVALPTFDPAGCADGVVTGLRYSVNGGAPVDVTLPAANVNITGLTLGANVITWQTYVISSGAIAGISTQIVTVVDNEKPTITCPNNVTLNLGPGACSISYSYNVTATENCPLFGPIQTLQTSSQTQNNNFDGVTFDIQNNGTNPILITGFLAPIIAGAHTVNAYYTTTATTAVGNQANPAAWTLLGSAPVTGNGTAPTTVIPIGGLTLQPGQRKGIYLYLTDLTTFYYANGDLTSTDGTLTIISQNHAAGGAPFVNANVPRAFIGSVLYQQAISLDPALSAGIESGGEFPIGTTTNCFVATDVAGNSSSCCFTVTVNEYPNAIQSLVCNDLVQVSVDENCQAVINADQVLEGGPYGCYNNYIVEFDKTLPFGNGPWVPAVAGPADIGKTYQVRVTDPKTGNKCWGNIKIEDKLPPVLDCLPYSLYCNTSTVPCEGEGPVFSSADPIQFPASIFPHGAGAITVAGNLVSGGSFFDLRNDGPEDIQIFGYEVRFGSDIAGAGGLVPSPQQVNTYYTTSATTYVGNEANPGAWTSSGSASVTVAGNMSEFSYFNLPAPFILPAGATKGIYLHGVNASLVYNSGANSSATPITIGQLTLTPGRANQAEFSIASGLTPRTPNVVIHFALPGDGLPCLPNGLELNVNTFATGGGCYTVNANAGDPVLEPCSAATLCYIDTEVTQNCASGLTKKINRKWTATDASGNTATCIQVIDILRPTFANVDLPPSYDDIDEPALSCGGQFPTPDYLEGIGLQGYPYVFGKPDGCSIGWTYEDGVIEVCDGTYKVVREWKVIDWCDGGVNHYDQVIKVLDEEGPTFSCPANITVSTDPFTCCSTVDLPDFIATDNCSRIKAVTAMVTVTDPQTGQVLNMYNVGGSMSNFPGNNLWEPDTMVNVGSTPCLPIGTHLVQYTLEDDCGNTSTCSFRVIVRDYTPPVAACDEFTVVGIGVDDPFDCYGPAGFLDVPPALDACSFAGVTWVKATTFDDGSYDNCGDVRFTIRRMAPYSDCITGLNPIRGFPDCASPFPTFPSEFERAITEGDSIKFYCCEVGTEQTVVLTVYQLDVNGNIVVGPTGEPVRNECMITVSVQDKIKPVCQSPANVTVSCENFDPSLWAYGKAAVYDNCCLDTAQVYQGQCGLSHTANYNFFDTLCSKGTITRTFRAFDCHGQSSQCTQRVFVNYEQDYWLKFPNDVIITVCDGTGNYGEPEFNGEDCELLGVSFEDEIFTVVPDACYKIERTWTVINWCTYSPNQPCVAVPNPNPNATSNNPANLVGPTIAPLGTPQPWTPTNVRVNPTDPQTTNYSVFYHGGTYTNYATGQQITVPSIANNNCFKYKQIIKIIDGQKPVVQCPASPVEICDLTPNDSQFWNESYWYDAQTMSHDLCEAPTDLCVTATDLCSGSNISIRYILFLDLNGDGVMETVVSSSNPPGYNNVQFGNAQNPNFTGGTPSAFDERPVPANQKYGFTIQNTVSGNDKTACVRWNTIQQPNNYVVPQLPYGTHKIKWVVTDGCGNEEVCEYTFVVKDCKKPTVVCINGLSVNIMPTKMISLWDTDFLQYTEDNCTPSNLLKTAIRKSGTGTGFPTNPDGTPQKSVTFDCNELGTQFVELWSMDLAGNADYCETYVIVQDNMGICGTNFGNVAGALKTEGANGLEDATVTLTGSHPALPGGSLFDVTNQTGDYMLNAVPLAGDFTLTPMKDNDPLNGVSTFDLVLINKHILGLEPLNTPYKMIAADANNSRSITTFDIVELRKLILGIYTELPNNTSWRFVDKAYNFPNPANPFSTIFPETKQIANMQASMDQEDFVSVKTGDVNGNAVTSSLMSTEDRTAGTLLFDVEDRAVKAGEEFTVTFKAAEKVQGYQFTMNYNNLELVNIAPGASMQLDNFGVFAKEGALTTSWDGTNQAEFALTFRAKANGMLSQMLGVSSRITKAEAYNAGADRLSVAFRFNGANGSTIAGLGFELYQNTPNPFINKTQIGFYLPEAAEATLSIFDESGRMIFTQRGDYSKGYNAVTIDRGVLNTSGVLYYQLETADNSATRKMIQSK